MAHINQDTPCVQAELAWTIVESSPASLDHFDGMVLGVPVLT